MRTPSPANWLAPTLAPAAYLLLCALAGALLGYPLVLALHGAAPLHVVIGRLGQGLLFVGAWPLMRRLGMRFAEFGLGADWRRFLRQAGIGFGLGVAMLGLHALGLVLLDIRVINPERIASAQAILKSARNALLTGLAVAVVEEILFRGFLLGALAKAAPKAAAAAICSFYFAALHFLKPAFRPEFTDLHWYTGLQVTLDAFLRLPERIQPDAFLALFAAGLLLAAIRLMRPGNLGYCIGMHAGWVFVIKLARSLTWGNPNENLILLVSGYDGVIGYLSAGWTALLLAGLWTWGHRRPQAQ
jgi:membrane protease YdiL (CAAX protease family)